MLDWLAVGFARSQLSCFCSFLHPTAPLDQAIPQRKLFTNIFLQNLTRMVMLTTTWEVRGGDPLTIYSFQPCGQPPPHFPNPAALAN